MEETKPGTRHNFTKASKTVSQSRNPDHSQNITITGTREPDHSPTNGRNEARNPPQHQKPEHSPTEGTRAKTSFFFSPANDLRK
jgi:hypothetical protein